MCIRDSPKEFLIGYRPMRARRTQNGNASVSDRIKTVGTDTDGI